MRSRIDPAQSRFGTRGFVWSRTVNIVRILVTCGDLQRTYTRIAGIWRTPVAVYVDTGLVSRVAGVALPVPGGLAADLVESLEYPMMAVADDLAGLVAEPPGGPLGVEDAVRRAVASPQRRPVNALADEHHLADTDPEWAGGDASRIQQLAGTVTPSAMRRVLRLIGILPGPVAGAVRASLDTVIGLVPKGGPE